MKQKQTPIPATTTDKDNKFRKLFEAISFEKIVTIHEKAMELLGEPSFALFKHADLYCCIQRVMWSGHLCGYVAVPESHPLYGKHYDELAFDVHGGITYAENKPHGIDDHLLGKLWWLGFDSIHSGDLKPFSNAVDRQFPISGEVYRNFDYMKEETKRLADQLAGYHH